jgi:dihydroflavonol-4-reductase
MSRILITGATGFIGSQLAHLAIESGHQVTAVSAVNNDVERTRLQELHDAGINVLAITLEQHELLAAALRGQDAVIHLAAAQHEADKPESYFRQVNVEGTRTMLELAVSCGVGRFVQGSTIGVYGEATEGTLTESSPIAPMNMYGRTKAQAETVAKEYASRISLCIARISETYGPGDMRLLKLFRAVQRQRYMTIGSGDNTHQLIYVADLARGLLAAADRPLASGTLVVLAGAETLSTDEVVRAIAAGIGSDLSVHHVPLWPFSLAATLFEATMPRFGLKPLLHQRRLDFFRKSFSFSTHRAEQLLAFRSTTSFSEGARLTGQWYRDHGLLTV